MRRWQNVPNYREYADRVLTDRSPINSTEELTTEMKRAEKIAMLLRTREGVPIKALAAQSEQIREFVALGFLQQSNSSFVLTRAGKSVADSVAEALI
jgi:coproporphyrinogen III oxidase-like Fe-S oxidoreductase